MSDTILPQTMSWDELESLPAYKKASPEDQLAARSEWFSTYAVQSPEFQAASPVEQRMAYQHVMSKHLTLDDEDPNYAESADLHNFVSSGAEAAKAYLIAKGSYEGAGFFGGLVRLFDNAISGMDIVQEETKNPITQANRLKIQRSAELVGGEEAVSAGQMVNLGMSLGGFVIPGIGLAKAGSLLGKAAPRLNAVFNTEARTAALLKSKFTPIAQTFLKGTATAGQAAVDSALYTASMYQTASPEKMLEMWGTPQAASNAQWLMEQFGLNFVADIGLRVGLMALKPIESLTRGIADRAGAALNDLRGVSADDISKNVGDILAGSELSPSELAALPVGKAEMHVNKLRSQVQEDVGFLSRHEMEELLQTPPGKHVMLIGKTGLGVIPEDGKWLLLAADNTPIGRFATRDDALKQGFKTYGQSVEPLPRDVMPATDESIRIEVQGSAILHDITGGDVTNMGKAVDNLTTALQRGDTAVFKETYNTLTKQGAHTIEFVDAKNLPDAAQRLAAKEAGIIYVPSNLQTKAAQNFFKRSSLPRLAGQLDPAKDPHLFKTLTNARMKELDNILDLPSVQATLKRIDPEATLVPDGDMWLLKNADGGELNFPDLHSASSFLKMRDPAFDMNGYNAYLAKKGLKIVEREGGRIGLVGPIAGRGKLTASTELNEYVDLEDLWNKRPDLTPDKDIAFAPTGIQITDLHSQVSVNGNVMTGPLPILMQYKGLMRDPTSAITSSVKQINKGRTVLSVDTKAPEIRITIPETGASYTGFKNGKQALEFAEKGVSNWRSITDAALTRGLQIYPERGGFTVLHHLDPAKTVEFVTSVDDLTALIKKYEVPAFAKNEYLQPFNSVIQSVRATDPYIKGLAAKLDPHFEDLSPKPFAVAPKLPVPEMGPKAKAFANLTAPLRMIRTRFAEVDRMTKSSAFTKMYNVQDQAVRTADATYNAVTAQVKRGWVRIKQTRREDLYELFTTSAKDFDNVAVRLQATEHEVNAVRATIDAFDQVGRSIGVNAQLMRESYIPRLKKAFDTKGSIKDIGTVDGPQALKNVLGVQKLPEEIQSFTSELRYVHDVQAVALEKDPLALFEKYTRSGIYKKIMEPAYAEVNKFRSLKSLQENKVLTDEQLMKMPRDYDSTMQTWIKSMKGLDRTATSIAQAELLNQARFWIRENVTKPIRERLGMPIPNFTISNDDFVDVAKKFVGMNFLGFSVGKSFRDTMQVYGVGAPYLGHDVVAAAITQLNRNPQMRSEVTSKALQRGHIALNASSYGNIDYGTTTLDKAVHIALTFQHEVDIESRIIIEQASKMRYEGAYKYFEATKDLPGFMKRANMGSLDVADQQEILDKLAKGGKEAGLDQYQTTMQRMINFSYRKSDLPTALQGGGMITKMFGHFGTYSVSYADTISRAMKASFENEGIAGLIKVTGTLTLATMGLTAVYSKFLQTNPSTALPWNQMMFSGGPLYSLMNDGLGSMQSGFKGDQARRDLQQTLTRIWGGPFANSFMGTFRKGIEEGNPGEAWAGIMALTYYPPDK